MRFEWDENKNQSNQAKHGLGFETAICVFEDPSYWSYQDRFVDGEERWQTIGLASGVLLVLVAHTVREEEQDEVIRLISARKANKHEERIYETHIQENS